MVVPSYIISEQFEYETASALDSTASRVQTLMLMLGAKKTLRTGLQTGLHAVKEEHGTFTACAAVSFALHSSIALHYCIALDDRVCEYVHAYGASM